ncbi:YciI family protein [Stutzerimonas kunmingensis]|uniref:YciI family protein n=1 Tax=Stutzerimonas kunmingensis TaxID=1211807 RepID=UPI0028ADAE32|nr:YciI family protein [Stutzerimonas kunmingensis]
MPYLIETFDKPGHQQLRRETRDEHLRFLEANKALLLACGAKLADDGSDLGGGLYVVDLETRDKAERFIADDPFSRVELFERVTITRWRKAYLAGRCFL